MPRSATMSSRGRAERLKQLPERPDSITTAFTLLQQIASCSGDTTAADLQKATGTAKSTFYRTMATLERLGMVRQNPESGRYRLGLRLWRIVGQALHDFDINEANEPILRDL